MFTSGGNLQFMPGWFKPRYNLMNIKLMQQLDVEDCDVVLFCFNNVFNYCKFYGDRIITVFIFFCQFTRLTFYRWCWRLIFLHQWLSNWSKLIFNVNVVVLFSFNLPIWLSFYFETRIALKLNVYKYTYLTCAFEDFGFLQSLNVNIRKEFVQIDGKVQEVNGSHFSGEIPYCTSKRLFFWHGLVKTGGLFCVILSFFRCHFQNSIYVRFIIISPFPATCG